MSRDERERLRDIRADIAGLRDLIAHEYFRIDIHRVIEIAERDLPPLESGDRPRLRSPRARRETPAR